MLIKPSAMNALIIGLTVIVFVFIWRTVSSWLSSRDGMAERVGEAMAVLI